MTAVHPDPPGGGRPVIARTIPASKIPEINATVEEAVDDFRWSPRFTCGHAPVPVVYLCAAHPKVGLKCRRCMTGHLLRHEDVDEHRCDVCFEVVELINGVSIPWEAADFEVRTTRRKRLAMWGPFNVVGVGLCSPCLSAKAPQ